MAVVFLLGATGCLVAKRWSLGIGLLIPGILLLGSWQYDRIHETTSTMQVALLDNTLVEENREHPEKSVRYVRVTAMEMGKFEGKLRAANIHLTKPGTIVEVEIGRRPFSGSYLKSVSSLDYGKPAPKYTYVPPPSGGEFQYVFSQPAPTNVTLLHVISEHDSQSAMIALAFRTDHATFDRIRPAQFEPIPLESFSLNRTAKQEVDWWRLATDVTEIWGRNARDGTDYKRNAEDHFDTDEAMMTWDKDGLVQYLRIGRGLRTDR